MLSFVTRAPAENPSSVLRLSTRRATPRQPNSHTGLGHFGVNIDEADQDPTLFSSIKRMCKLGPLALLGILFPPWKKDFYIKLPFCPLVGTSKPVTPTPTFSGYLPVPTPTDDKSPLTVAAFGKVSCNLGRGWGGLFCQAMLF